MSRQGWQDEEEKLGCSLQPALLLRVVAGPGRGSAQGGSPLLGKSWPQRPGALEVIHGGKAKERGAKTSTETSWPVGEPAPPL